MELSSKSQKNRNMGKFCGQAGDIYGLSPGQSEWYYAPRVNIIPERSEG